MNQMHILMVICALLMVSTYQNCSTASPDVTKATNDPFDTGGVKQPLAIYPSLNQVPAGQTLVLTPVGGVEPYQVTVLSGDADVYVNGTSGSWILEAGNTLGSVSIGVSDADGQSATASVSIVADDGTNPGGNPPPVACASGTHTSNLSCMAANSCSVTLDFASKVPAGCKVTNFKLKVTHFGSRDDDPLPPRCMSPVELTFADSGNQQSGQTGNKVALLRVNADFQNYKAIMTSFASGWGGNNPACISTISYELTLSSN